jgi:hypothetical protein
MSFDAMGLDLEREYNVREDKGCVTYSDFARELLARYKITAVHLADSHVHGWASATLLSQVSGAPLEVVHFDAHHDLGYGAKEVKTHAARGICECGDWLYHALRMDIVSRATVVYPNWRDEDEPDEWLDPYRDRVEFTRWTPWLEATAADEQQAAGVFTCRSAGWSPPYLDRAWLGLARRLGNGSFKAVADDSADTPRDWNPDTKGT